MHEVLILTNACKKTEIIFQNDNIYEMQQVPHV